MRKTLMLLALLVLFLVPISVSAEDIVPINLNGTTSIPPDSIAEVAYTFAPKENVTILLACDGLINFVVIPYDAHPRWFNNRSYTPDIIFKDVSTLEYNMSYDETRNTVWFILDNSERETGKIATFSITTGTNRTEYVLTSSTELKLDPVTLGAVIGVSTITALIVSGGKKTGLF